MYHYFLMGGSCFNLHDPLLITSVLPRFSRICSKFSMRRQKPKPEPHVLHVFRDALHCLMWPVDQLWQVGLEQFLMS